MMFEDIEHTIESRLSFYSGSISSQLISDLLPLCFTGVGIYLLLKGYLIATGRVQDPVSELCVWAFKALTVSYFALNAGNFMSYGIAGLSDLESMLMHALPSSPSSLGSSIDQMWETLLKLLTTLGSFMSNFGVTEIGYALLTAILIVVYLAAAAFLTLACLGVLITTKIVLIIASGFGPFFLCLMMFPMTRSFFDGWLKFTLTQVFTLVLLSGLVIFSTELIGYVIGSAEQSLSQELEVYYQFLAGTFTVVVIALALAVTFRQMPAAAAALVGSTALAAAGIGQMVGGLGRGTSSVTRTAAGAVGALQSGGVGGMALQLTGAGGVLSSYTGAKRGVLAAQHAMQQAAMAAGQGDLAGQHRAEDLAAQSLSGNRYAMDQVDAPLQAGKTASRAQEAGRQGTAEPDSERQV